jgi:hypothetical protein
MYLITIDVPATGVFFKYSRRVSEVGPKLGFYSLISNLSCCGWPGVLQTSRSLNASGLAAWKKDGAYGTLISRLHSTDVTANKTSECNGRTIGSPSYRYESFSTRTFVFRPLPPVMAFPIATTHILRNVITPLLLTRTGTYRPRGCCFDSL